MGTGGNGDWCSGGGGLRRREGSSAVVVQWGSTKGSVQTQRWLQLDRRRLMASWPHTPASAAVTALVAARYDGEARPGRGVSGAS
jgi:hypothetical protein